MDLETIRYDVMGRTADDSDFHGIRTLLNNQLLPNADVDVGNLTDLIIEQNYVGSVIAEDCTDALPEEEDEVDDGLEEITLLGVTTVVGLQEREKFPCVEQLRHLLDALSQKHGGSSQDLIKKLLNEKPCSLGLLVNERFVNIPSAIAPPIFNSLKKELRSAINKKMSFNFTHYVLIAKIRKVKIGNEVEDEWVNAEEEFLDDKALCKFEFPLEDQTNEEIQASEEQRFRRVLVFPAEAFDSWVESISCKQ